MKRASLAAGFLLAVALPVAPPASAEPAHNWLMRMNEAARRLNFDGTFVYVHEGQVETLRIVHRNDNGRERERLVSLNGPPREILRNDRMVLCYLPGEKSILLKHRKADSKNFPAILPERISELDENYTLALGETARIGGRNARQVQISPRDTLRYGYHLWADTETGLLLRADLRSPAGETVEQFMFTQLTLGAVSPAALEPENAGPEVTWDRLVPTEERATPDATPPRWTVTDPPRGFRLASHRTAKGGAAEHLVYSDGFATVSVFIDKAAPTPAAAMEGTGRMGAVHVFGRRLGDNQITVVGEVPETTVSLIGGAVSPRR